MQRLAIIGLGRMGQSISQLAPDRGFEVVARIDPRGGDAATVSRASLNGAEVAVEFSTPASAVANIIAAVDAGCPVVAGTTGWYDRRGEVEQHVLERGGAMLAAPNFSVGVAAFTAILLAASRALGTIPGFEAHLVETHHSAKKDAPSGTAASLAAAAEAVLGKPLPITSIRVGAVPGTHEVVFDAPFEQIRITHEARDRRVFADGALLAAKWLVGKRGLFTMADVLAA